MNPYESPAASSVHSRPPAGLLGTISKGTLGGLAVGLAFAVMSTALLCRDGTLFEDIYWLGHLANCAELYLLPSILLGTAFGTILGLARMAIQLASRRIRPRG